ASGGSSDRAPPHAQVVVDRRRHPHVALRALAEIPLVLEDLAVELGRVALAQRLAQPVRDGSEALLLPAVRRHAQADAAVLLARQPGAQLLELVQEELRLPVAGDEPGQAVEEPAVVVAVAGDRAQAPPVAVPGLDQLELAYREAEVIERADALLDAVALAGQDRELLVDLAPQPLVAVADAAAGVLHRQRGRQAHDERQVGELA